jgi:hypothetical protein
VSGEPQRTEAHPDPRVGDTVKTPLGPGTLAGWHRSETWFAGRLERRCYLLVEFDGRGPRLFPAGTVTAVRVDEPEAA